MALYDQHHPHTDLSAVSTRLCEGIDRARNRGTPTDLFLLVLHVAEETEAVMFPAGHGWRLERGQHKVTFNLGGQLVLTHCNDDDGWDAVDEEGELGDALPFIVRWLTAAAPEESPETAGT